MAKQKRRSYAEPWTAERSPTWQTAYRLGPPTLPETDPLDQRQAVLDWEAKKHKAEENAPWILWGSGLSTPAVCTSLMGKVSVSSDTDIIAIHKRGSWEEGQPTHQDMAVRIKDCVNAMAGVPNPTEFMAELRELLAELARGDTDRCDVRIGRLYAMSFTVEEIPI